MITALIIDDSELARLELLHQLKDRNDIQVVGEAEDIVSARQLIAQRQPHLLFLDIDMPGGNAFELLKTLPHCPRIIFTTAYDHFALEAFEYPTVDYLLKPIQAPRLAKALAKLSPESHGNVLALDKPLMIKDGERHFLIKLRDVRVIEALGNYSRLHTENQAPMVYSSLTKLEERLDPTVFFRASRQHIINVTYIEKIGNNDNGNLLFKMQGGVDIEVSRRQSQLFKERLSF